jgi:hypothetical protein
MPSPLLARAVAVPEGDQNTLTVRPSHGSAFGQERHGSRSTLTARRSTGSGFTHEHWSTRRASWQNSTVWCTGTFDNH